jgi:hypothetical protein
MPASFASTQLESDHARFGNPKRFKRIGKRSSGGFIAAGGGFDKI